MYSKFCAAITACTTVDKLTSIKLTKSNGATIQLFSPASKILTITMY